MDICCCGPQWRIKIFRRDLSKQEMSLTKSNKVKRIVSESAATL